MCVYIYIYIYIAAAVVTTNIRVLQHYNDNYKFMQHFIVYELDRVPHLGENHLDTIQVTSSHDQMKVIHTLCIQASV